MKGEVNESYLSEVHKRNKERNQTSLNEFAGGSSSFDLGTTIAVVKEPQGGIVEVCDEFKQELGMPKEKLQDLRDKRESLDYEDADDVKTHNKAVKELNLEEIYRNYVRKNSVIQDRIDELARRVLDGETITVVCFEKQNKWCHRHVLVDEIKTRIAELED